MTNTQQSGGNKDSQNNRREGQSGQQASGKTSGTKDANQSKMASDRDTKERK